MLTCKLFSGVFVISALAGKVAGKVVEKFNDIVDKFKAKFKTEKEVEKIKEEPKVEEIKIEEPKVEEIKVEEPKVEEPERLNVIATSLYTTIALFLIIVLSKWFKFAFKITLILDITILIVSLFKYFYDKFNN